MTLLAAVVDGRWRPGIGDPTVVGWLTVAGYFVAALACLRAARRDHARTGPRPAFWLGLFALVAFLGVNKQLDLQSLLTQTARDFFRQAGLYEQRRTYQVAFIAAVAAAGLALVVVAVRLTRGHPPRMLAAGGLVFLVGFVTVRAASFHRVDALLGSTVGGLRWNGVFELTGITLVAAGALRVRRPTAPARPGRPPGYDGDGRNATPEGRP